MRPPTRYAWLVLALLGVASCGGREAQEPLGTERGGASGTTTRLPSGGSEPGLNAANGGNTASVGVTVGDKARGGQGAAVSIVGGSGGLGGISTAHSVSLTGGRPPLVTASGGRGSSLTTFALGGFATTITKGGAGPGGGTTYSLGGGGAASGGKSATVGTTPATGGAANNSIGGSTSLASAGSNAAAAAPATRVWATIAVSLSKTDDQSPTYTTLAGVARDAAPLPSMFSITKESGLCRLLAPKYSLCVAPSCTPLQTCIAEDTCAKSPVTVSMGTLVLRGLTSQTGGSRELTVAPINNNYSSAELAFPPCTPGSDVTASGGEDAATRFDVKTSCIDPLVVTDVEPIRFAPGEPITLHWAMPTVASQTRIQVRVDISHHGGLTGLIVCDAPDSGSLTIDSQLVTSLISLGAFGFPIAQVTRLSTATVSETSTQATLNVQATRELSLAIPGLTSCTSEMPCPTGQTCSAYRCM